MKAKMVKSIHRYHLPEWSLLPICTGYRWDF